jgi:hypothetical protein
MNLKLSWWSIALGLLALLIVFSIFGIVKLDAWSIFWLAVTVFCVWAIMRTFFPKKME